LGFAECTKAFVHFSFQPPFDSCIWRPWNSHHWSGVDFALVRGLLVGALNFSSKASLCSDSLGPQHRLDCFPLCCSSSVRLCLDLSALKRFQYLGFYEPVFGDFAAPQLYFVSVAGLSCTATHFGCRQPCDQVPAWDALTVRLHSPHQPSVSRWAVLAMQAHGTAVLCSWF
jgi:hypothetical protein